MRNMIDVAPMKCENDAALSLVIRFQCIVNCTQKIIVKKNKKKQQQQICMPMLKFGGYE